MTGQVVHFDLPFDDPVRAKAFYQEAFGWAISDVPGMDYTIVTTVASDEAGTPTEPGAINGGMARRQEPLTAPTITIQVDDVERALDTVEKLGGQVVQGRREVGAMGFTGYVADPEGNVVGLWEDKQD